MKTETRVGIFVIIAIGIFFYLSLNIGAIRLDQRQYYAYKTYFDDTGGLDKKAPVKIAGVEVGWVESIELEDEGKARVVMMIHKRNKLARNAFATVQQEGLIGAKHIDIDPGDPTTGMLPPGSTLSMPGRAPTSVGTLLERFKDIASDIQDVVSSFKNTFGTRHGEDRLRTALNSVALATQRIANFSQVLERTLQKNERNIDLMLQDFRETAHHLTEAVPSFKDDFHNLSTSFETNADKLTVALADDTLPYVADASKHAGTAFERIGDTAQHAKGTFKEAESVARKLNEGEGVLGKLINEDETYDDIKKTVRGFKAMVEKAETLDILIDMHSETHFKTSNNKGYIDIRLRPYCDYFYNIQLASSEFGRIKKQDKFLRRYDSHNNYLSTDLIQTQYFRIDAADREEKVTQIKNDVLFGFQFGKRFDRVALRVGLFESTFGFGCDYYIPLPTSMLHWITGVEVFDMKGANRIDSTRPHIKWINKLFFMRHIYTNFGIDDICSKGRSTPFFGAGIRFGDNDIRHLLSHLPMGGIK